MNNIPQLIKINIINTSTISCMSIYVHSNKNSQALYEQFVNRKIHVINN